MRRPCFALRRDKTRLLSSSAAAARSIAAVDSDRRPVDRRGAAGHRSHRQLPLTTIHHQTPRTVFTFDVLLPVVMSLLVTLAQTISKTIEE